LFSFTSWYSASASADFRSDDRFQLGFGFGSGHMIGFGFDFGGALV
jgi:hypothetical protein